MGSFKWSYKLIELSPDDEDEPLSTFSCPCRITTTSNANSLAASAAVASSAAASNTKSLDDDSSDEESAGEKEVEFLKSTGLPPIKSRLPSTLAKKAAGQSCSGVLFLLLDDVGGKKLLADSLSCLFGSNEPLSPYDAFV